MKHRTPYTLKRTVRKDRTTESGLVAFYDIWLGNGAGLFFDPVREL